MECTGYRPQIVENAIRLAVGRSAVVVPARGKSIKAVNLPMSEWKRKTGEVHGNHWIENTPSGRMRTVANVTAPAVALLIDDFELDTVDDTQSRAATVRLRSC